MSIIKIIKSYFAKRKLRTWHKDWSVPSKKRIKDVANGDTRVYTPQLDSFIDKACIRRYYDSNRACVDIYWHIKPSRNEGHVYTIHYRRDWHKVAHTIDKVEKHELPRAFYDAIKHYHQSNG